MKVSDFKVYLAKLEDEEHNIMFQKGREYTMGSDDKLANFKAVAGTTGLTPLQVWSVYFQKHIASILNFVKDGKVHSEPIRGRFQDARNYLALGIALIEEAMENPATVVTCQVTNNKLNCSDGHEYSKIHNHPKSIKEVIGAKDLAEMEKWNEEIEKEAKRRREEPA